MAKYINPFTDVGFKIIFGQDINKSLLLDFRRPEADIPPAALFH